MKLAMAITEKEKKKSWGIRFREGIYDNNEVSIVGVDMETDYIICYFMTFTTEGRIFCTEGAKKALLDRGYDPYEHNNTFTEKGAIIIDREEKQEDETSK